jgi:hypothetical protein
MAIVVVDFFSIKQCVLLAEEEADQVAGVQPPGSSHGGEVPPPAMSSEKTPELQKPTCALRLQAVLQLASKSQASMLHACVAAMHPHCV